MVQIVRSASCFRPRVRHLPLRIQHRRPVGTVICRFSEWCSAHLFVLPAIAKGLHVARLPIVIWLSQLLISIVNKVAPEEAPKKKVAATGVSTDAGAMDAIKAAVDILTAGKGQVIKVEKLQ